jgi:hypothetical protein
MITGKTMFAQLMEFVPRTSFMRRPMVVEKVRINIDCHTKINWLVPKRITYVSMILLPNVAGL